MKCAIMKGPMFKQNAQQTKNPPAAPPILPQAVPAFKPLSCPITDDYKISKNVLGVGINGKVVECTKRKTGDKFALKVRFNLSMVD